MGFWYVKRCRHGKYVLRECVLAPEVRDCENCEAEECHLYNGYEEAEYDYWLKGYEFCRECS